MGEVRGVLGRYPRLRSLRVGVSTGSWKVAEVVRERIRGVIGEEREGVVKGRAEVFVEVELMGHVVEGK